MHWPTIVNLSISTIVKPVTHADEVAVNNASKKVKSLLQAGNFKSHALINIIIINDAKII
jgi:hypothetical protein